MKRSIRKQKLVSEINITPFTDVILVLLVIFMISTPLIYQTSIKVKLPEAKGGGPEKQPGAESVEVTITNENIVYLGKEIATRKEFAERIKARYQKNPQLKVVLYADKLVQFKDIVEILDVLTKTGITKLDIAAINKQ